MPESSSKPRFGRVLGKASSSGVNLSVAGSALLGAAALHSWPLLALGGAAYVALVAWDVTNPRFWQRAFARTAAAPSLPDLASLTGDETRQAVHGIATARRELERVVDETPAEVKSQLGVALSSVIDLERRAVRLVARAEDLARYLVRADLAAVRSGITRLEEQARRSGDAEARRELESARGARQEQLRALEDVTAAHERIVANLTRIGATLEALPAKIVRLRALDAQAMDHLSGDVNQELDDFNLEIKSFEETLSTLVEVPPA